METSILISISISGASLAVLVWVVYGFSKHSSFQQDLESEKQRQLSHPSLSTRIMEAQAYILRKRPLIRIYKYLSTGIKFFTLILGVLLTTSLIEDTLTPNEIGWCGIAVVVATLIDYLLRPTDRWRKGIENEVAILSKIRNIEDDMAFSDSDKKASALTKELTALLNEIQARGEV